MTTLTDGDDTQTAKPGETLFGIGGNDALTASATGNALYGGDGNDTLNGANGDDQLIGDDHTAMGGETHYTNVLNGFGGNDSITSYSYNDQIDAGAGDDLVSVYAQETGQNVKGGTGNDTLELFALGALNVPVTVIMGSTFSPSVDSVQGATYYDFENLVLYGGTGSVYAQGASGGDHLIANWLANSGLDAGTLRGGAGDDVLEFNGMPNNGTGEELIAGGADTDTLAWSPGNIGGSFGALVIDVNAGEMSLDGTEFCTFSQIEGLKVNTYQATYSSVEVTGGSSADTLTIRAGHSTLDTGDGDDTVSIVTGTSTINTGDGDDHVSIAFSGAGLATIHGGNDNDTLSGGQASVAFFGDDGDDHLSAYGGSTLTGGAGNDTLYLSTTFGATDPSAAVVDGGSGRDLLSTELSMLTDVSFKVDFTKASITLANGTKILNCEGISFTAAGGKDVLTASNDAAGQSVNKLFGLGENDTLRASSNGAWLDGGAGDDLLIAGAGADNLVGGYNETNITGDTVSYANSKKGVTVNLALATAQQSKGDAAGDVLSKIENLVGSKFNDKLTGNDPGDFAHSGKNVLTGGKGNDRLTGGLALDTFVFATGDGKDTITDFTAKGSDHDVIDLSRLSSITSFSDLKAHHLEKSGSDVVIDGLNGDSITLLDVNIKDLGKGDFLF